ncbi:hypothetical protein ABTX99_12480 [Streptomyces flaveolus]|uniref:hypothetical protein n=1 Tax=Streptomyces flaveolus TaxID=67297 RepID=UPI003321FB52
MESTGVTVDTDDADTAGQRDIEAAPNGVGVPNGWGTVEICGQETQAASPAPTDAPEGNYPPAVMDGHGSPVPDDEMAPVTALAAAETPATPQPADKKAEKTPDPRPKASTGKRAPDAAPATKSAPETPEAEPDTYVVQQTPEPESMKIEEDANPDAWDNLGDFLGFFNPFFNPFFACVPPAFLPEGARPAVRASRKSAGLRSPTSWRSSGRSSCPSPCRLSRSLKRPASTPAGGGTPALDSAGWGSTPR